MPHHVAATSGACPMDGGKGTARTRMRWTRPVAVGGARLGLLRSS